jgi:hypothetical protein
MTPLRKLWLIALTGTMINSAAVAQLIIPVRQWVSPQQHFDFQGQWNCSDGSSIAHLNVGMKTGIYSLTALQGGNQWTGILENEDGFVGKYLVAYDHDHNQFLLIDLEDPAAAAFRTDAWDGNALILSSVSNATGSFPPYRIRYEVNDANRFTVTWEMKDGPGWVNEPSVACVRAGSQRQLVKSRNSPQTRFPGLIGAVKYPDH